MLSSHRGTCMFCDKAIKHAKNIKLHEGTCKENPNRCNAAAGYGTTIATSTEGNDDFMLVNSAFKNTISIYRKKFEPHDMLDSMKHMLEKDVKELLQNEAYKRLYFKWYIALKVVFQKSADPSIQTDPPACFRTEPRLGLIGTDYEENLEHVFQSLLDKIDCYERNGSGWIVHNFVDMDVTICNIDNPLGGKKL